MIAASLVAQARLSEDALSGALGRVVMKVSRDAGRILARVGASRLRTPRRVGGARRARVRRSGRDVLVRKPGTSREAPALRVGCGR